MDHRCPLCGATGRAPFGVYIEIAYQRRVIQSATKDLRKELLAAFLNPSASLTEAAGPLTKLAVRGRILYDRLAGPAGEYHDADDWIHVNAFSKNDVPIELVYWHPMPSSDDVVFV